MKFIPTELTGVIIIEPDVYEDERGWFMESFNQRKFEEGLQRLGLPLPDPFVQDNQSSSRKGVLRGLHYQMEPIAQGKLVSVVEGAAFDVAVDIRPDSPNYGKWVGLELNAANKKMLWIPVGFAHGFLALEENTKFCYKTTNYYNKDSERSVLWCDNSLGIDWPDLGGCLLNEKDQAAPVLAP